MLQLLEDQTVFTRIISLVLHVLDAVLNDVFTKREFGLSKGPALSVHVYFLIFLGSCFSDCSDAGLKGREKKSWLYERFGMGGRR